MDIDRHVDEEQLQQSAAALHALITREIERGIDSSRIIVAGFSQGGAVSFEAGLTYAKPLAGIMALSTYFATADSIKVNPIQIGMPILVCHGSMDPVVAEALGQKSVATLKNLGFEPEYNSYPMEHSLCPQQIVDIADWIGRTLS
jgi:phospholipase/carboxylesterase